MMAQWRIILFPVLRTAAHSAVNPEELCTWSSVMKEQLWLSVLFLSGWYTFSSCLSHQYHFVPDAKTWSEAQSYCRERYTDLATVDNMAEMNQLIETVRAAVSTHQGAVWIGLYDVLHSWRWSLSDKAHYADGQANYRNWETKDDNEPANDSGKQFCVNMNDKGRWWDDNCKAEYPFICYNGSTNINTFVLVSEPKTWSGAQSFCRENHVDLASVRNRNENQEMQRLVPRGEWAWMGLYREPWRWWSDGSDSSFSYWNTPTEPNSASPGQVCAVAQFLLSGQWDDCSCGETWPSVCYSVELVKQQVLKLKFTLKDSTVDLNDNAVKEAILQQLQNVLKEKGLSANLKWRHQPDGKVFHMEDKDSDRKK